MRAKSSGKSLTMLVISMVIFGTIGIFRRYIPIGSAALAMSRGFIGTAVLVLIMLITGKKPDKRAIAANARLLIISGAFIGINWILLFEAYNHTSVAAATLCYYMAPIFVIFVSPLFLKEKLTLKRIICVAVALFGMVLISGVLRGTEGNNGITGILLGTGAAVFYASVIILNKKIQNISAQDKTAVQLISAAVVLIPYVIIVEKPGTAALTPTAIVLILAVGIIHTGFAYSMYFGAMDGLPAQTTALFSYIDPIVAIVLSAALLSEKMGVSEVIGAVCVLLAAVISELPEKKK